MPRLDGSLTKREEAAAVWRRQHELDAEGDPTISRQDPHFVPRASAMLRGNFSLANFGTPEKVVWWAAHENEMEIISQLSRDPSVDVNWKNAHGASPFYIAVRNGHLDSVRLMTNIRRIDYDAVCESALDASRSARNFNRFRIRFQREFYPDRMVIGGALSPGVGGLRGSRGRKV